MTPHNELVKSYKSVGCVPPRLKFLFRTFDRLPYINHIHIWVHGGSNVEQKSKGATLMKTLLVHKEP